ncbi:MAG: nucleotidyltransferase family protein [Lachnospiraceae bacterium]|jgi:molybdenum cofactor cytidylyltransferase
MIGGVILAAGFSSRMGQWKPLLPIGNTTFIKRLILQMREVGVEDIVVVTGYRHEELESHLIDEDVKCVCNEHFFETQMLDSVKLGISGLAKKYDRIMLSPVDVVMSPKWIFEKVINTEADFVRPVYFGEPGHPVILNRSLYDYVLKYTGGRGLRGAVESSGMKITDLEVNEPSILLDADTPEDYEKVIRLYDENRPDQEWHFR